MKYKYRIFLFVSAFLLGMHAFAEVYQKPEEFLQQAFENRVPEPEMLWIAGELRDKTEKILQHRPNTLRTRYWRKGQRTAWVLEEIGKEQPITVGIVINDNHIETIRVLVFRESRGWEVKYPFFTDQFKQARLKDNLQLNKPIDGITGATLSVRALTKLGRLALYYHQHVTGDA